MAVETPKFEDYPLRIVPLSRLAPPNLRSHPDAPHYKTRLIEAAKAEPNFAGHYTITTLDCGTQCVIPAILNAKTGQVFFPEDLRAIDTHDMTEDEFAQVWSRGGTWQMNFRRNSRLLIVPGVLNNDAKLRGTSYFVWENDCLHRIHFAPKPDDN